MKLEIDIDFCSNFDMIFLCYNMLYKYQLPPGN